MEKQFAIWTVTASGSYISDDRKIINFDDIRFDLPYIDRDIAEAMTIKRLAPMYIAKNKTEYPSRIRSVRKVYPELKKSYLSEDDFKAKFSFYGKNIKDLSDEDIQIVATVFDLKTIPVYKAEPLNFMLKNLYTVFNNDYLKKANKVSVDEVDLDDDYPIIIPHLYDGARSESYYQSPEQYFAQEESLDEQRANVASKVGKSKDVMPTFEELKEMATSKGIKFSANIGFNKLYAKVYNVVD